MTIESKIVATNSTSILDLPENLHTVNCRG